MIILTPNRRIAAFSKQQYNTMQMAQGIESWVSPEIYPIEVWLVQVWNLSLDNNLGFYKPLLHQKQQQLLFEQIIQNDGVSEQLLRINATAQNALQAWGFISQWQIPMHKLEAHAQFNADAGAFCKWLSAYLHWLTVHEYVDFNLLVDTIIANVESLKRFLPTHLCLRGFNELTPQYAKLFAILVELGLTITHDSLSVAGATVGRVGVQNADAELLRCCAWIDQELAKDQNQTIGVVLHDLEQRRDKVYNYFTRAFPSSWLNISAPKPLLNFELISTALLILNMGFATIEFSNLSRLLRSPFVGEFSKQVDKRARLDRRLRETLEGNFTLLQLLKVLEKDDPLYGCITKLQAMLGDLQGQHSAQYWVQQIQNILQCFGWPGEKLLLLQHASPLGIELSKNDADLLACWQALMDEYCLLSSILPKHSFAKAIQYIHRFATETPFAPSETGLTRIHVLGLLEAEGLIFDKLWVCGMSRDQWPKPPNPNPFIPIELQRQYDLPHSSAQRELLMAKKYTTSLQLGARSEVIFSYPQSIDDNQVAPSSLILALPMLETTESSTLLQELSLPESLEVWYDDKAPPHSDLYACGGTKVLQLQAQCPFKAVAQLRLHALPLVNPEIILTPMMRGSIVHKILEDFWRQCGSHAKLISYNTKELEELLSGIIQKVLLHWQKNLPQTLTNNYLTLEAERLYNLLSRWLAYEKSRPSFVVYQLENKTLVTIGPLQINVQIDRVDLVDNQYVIIDYKTGAAAVREWSKDAIHAPQLQIYAVGFAEEVGAVAFGAVLPKDLRFKGLACDDGLMPHVAVETDWIKTKSEWLLQLKQLAHNFITGQATVAPQNLQICNQCQLHAMCRIYAQ